VGHALSLRGAAQRFTAASRDQARCQDRLLRQTLSKNSETAYGKAHGFSRISSFAEFQAKVPIVDYDALAPEIARITQGEQNVLTKAPVLAFEPSGGSTQTTKLVPYTQQLLDEFGAATSPWLFDLYKHRRGLFGTQSYWSVSAVAQRETKTAGGTRIGLGDDTAYFGPLTRIALRRMLAVPGSVAREPSMHAWQEATLDHLVAAEDLGLISVWSPSFLTLLMVALEKTWKDRCLSHKRWQAIDARLQRAGRFVGEALWPRLTLLSAWTHGPAAALLPAMQHYFPTTELQGKGLLATEGVVTVPLFGAPAPVAAVTSHVLEFIDLVAPTRAPLRVFQLVAGGEYSPVLTTGGGFYRYHLKDVVRCEGHYRELACLRFISKLDRVSDLVGEKINAHQMEHALETTKQHGATFEFALLAPLPGTPATYCLFIESDLSDAAIASVRDEVEAYLRTGHHYRYARSLGQLGPMQVRRVRDGHRTFHNTLVAIGQKAGDIKPTGLDSRTLWAEAFLNVS